jgi:hypothetical protein
MIDIKEELGSLRIDRADPRPGRRRWPLLLALTCLPVLAFLYSMRAGGAIRTAAPKPRVRRRGSPGDTSASPLTARLRRGPKAGRHLKIQDAGGAAVEEGSRLERGELIARLESHDYEAQLRRGGGAAAEAELERVAASFTARSWPRSSRVRGPAPGRGQPAERPRADGGSRRSRRPKPTSRRR